MNDNTRPTDTQVVKAGLVVSDLVYDITTAMLEEHARSGHIAMVGLLHAAVRCEVLTRMPGQPSEMYRQRLHEVLDDVLDYEERLKESL